VVAAPSPAVSRGSACQAMALLSEGEVLVRHAARPQLGDKLLRLGLPHPRVIRSMADQQRDADLADPGHG